MMEDVIYGETPSIMIERFARPPPENILRRPKKSLLDKVFGSNAFDPIEPKPEIVETKPQNPNASWQLLQPLVAPNAVAEPIAPVAPVRVIEPISAEELAALSAPRTNQEDTDTKIKPGKRNTGGFSPMIMVSAVGLLFVMELLAIAFWKPLSVYISHQMGNRAGTSAHPPGKIKSAQKH